MAIYEDIQGAGGLLIEEVHGDLEIRGRTGTELIADGDEAEIQFPEESGGIIRFRCDGDCDLKVPETLPVQIANVGGDAEKITGLQANLEITTIHGNLMIRRIMGQVSVDTVSGDVAMKNIDGDVFVKVVHGDMLLQRIDGAIGGGHIAGDVSINDIVGDCRFDSVSGDIALNLTFSPDYSYIFAASGDIDVTMEHEHGVVFVMPAETSVNLRGRFENAAQTEIDEETGNKILRFGEGGAEVQIVEATEVNFGTSNGYSFEFNFEGDPGQQFREMESQLREGFANLGEMIEQTTRDAVENASRAMKDMRIETRVERARSRASRAEERARRAADRVSRRTERMNRFNRRQEQSTWEPVTNEERLLILQMVQDGKITVEEADQLLATLDGR